MGILSTKRIGKITASRIGSVLGLNKHKKRSEVMRDIVRAYLGAESEFNGNEATEHGNNHEEQAILCYELVNDIRVVSNPDFVQHPDYEFLGCTPDGLIGDDGLLEVKCPYYADLYTLADKPEYLAQVYLQLACTRRKYCDFFVWKSDDHYHQERVFLDEADEFIGKHINELEQFYCEFIEIINNKEKSAEYLEDLVADLSDDDEWLSLTKKYAELESAYKVMKKQLEDVKEKMIDKAKENGKKIIGGGYQVLTQTRQGTVNYKAIPELKDVDLSQYRNPSQTVYTIRKYKG